MHSSLKLIVLITSEGSVHISQLLEPSQELFHTNHVTVLKDTISPIYAPIIRLRIISPP